MSSAYPSVSVLVSTYNRASKLLPLALHSILEQDYKDFEVVVMDDASTDGTGEVLRRFDKLFRARRITMHAFRLTINSGYQCVPKNMGIYNASGDYIAYLDDDNEWMGNHLSRMMQEFDANPGLDMVYCWRKYIKDGHDGLDIEPHPPEWEKVKQYLASHQNLIDTSDMIHSRGIAYYMHYEHGCVWNPNDRRYGDLGLVTRLVQLQCKAKLVPEELTRYRWHGGNLMITRPVVDVAGVEQSVFEKQVAQ